MRFEHKMVLAGMVLMVAGGTAHAFEAGLVGQLEVTDPKFDPGQTGSTTAIGMGGGLLLSHYFFKTAIVGIETGALYTSYKTRIEDGTDYTRIDASYLQIPFMLRIQPDPAFSFGGGYYIGVPMGKASQETKSGATTTSTSVTSKSDSGLFFGGGGKIPFPKSKRLSILIDARYLIGSANLSQDSTFEAKYNHMQVLLGLTIKIGKGAK